MLLVVDPVHTGIKPVTEGVAACHLAVVVFSSYGISREVRLGEQIQDGLTDLIDLARRNNVAGTSVWKLDSDTTCINGLADKLPWIVGIGCGRCGIVNDCQAPVGIVGCRKVAVALSRRRDGLDSTVSRKWLAEAFVGPEKVQVTAVPHRSPNVKPELVSLEFRLLQ